MNSCQGLSLKIAEVRKSSRRDFNAGANLLSKYQTNWEEIHSLSEDNAKKARIIDKQIEDCFLRVKRERQIIRRFNENVADLGSIVIVAEKALNGIGNIRALIEDVQERIIDLEELIERVDHEARICGAREKLAQYRSERLISLDALRERLSEDYEEKAKIVEFEKEEIKKRNFEIAEKKFLQDFNAYKESGILPKKESVKQSVSIEEVEIEQDLDSLQEYLQA